MNDVYLFLLTVCAASGCYGQIVTAQEANKVSSGYVFYAPVSSESSYLIRNDGTIAHTWPGSGPAGIAVKVLADGAILRTLKTYNATFFAGNGLGGQVEKRSWNGELLWSYSLPLPEKYASHHDVTELPNGNILILAWELHSREEALAAGRSPDKIPEAGIWGEAIFEVRPEPPSAGAIIWEWHAWDHLVQDADAKGPHFGAVAGNPHRIDVNFTGSNANPGANPDWLHMNSVAYNAHLDQLILSSRAWSEIWIIDHSTTSEEAATSSGGKYKRGGDLLYRWGNPQAYKAGTAADRKLFNQHDAHWIDDDLPGAGHILVFNNGVGRGYSSADELVPPIDASGAYRLAKDGRFGPAEPVWTFGASAGPNFFTQTAGGTQRLRNGNTILCLSNANRVVEATLEGKIVWNLNLGAGEAGGFTFRANRIPADSAGLAGTALAAPAPVLLNAASVQPSALAPDALAIAAGTGFAVPASVEVTDSAGAARPAVILAASPGEITLQLPAQTAVGPARLSVRGADGAGQTRDFRVNRVSPGLFAANREGEGVGAVVAIVDSPQGRIVQAAYRFDPKADIYVPEAVPFTGPVYLSLYATGLADSSTPLSVAIGGLAVPVLFAGPLPASPGVHQINVGPLSDSLSGKRNQLIVVSQDGVDSNAVEVSFQ